MLTSKEYRHRAEECLKLANESKEIYARMALLELAGEFRARERWSCFLRQAVKVDSAMKRVIHHEDAETVFG